MGTHSYGTLSSTAIKSGDAEDSMVTSSASGLGHTMGEHGGRFRPHHQPGTRSSNIEVSVDVLHKEREDGETESDDRL